MFDSTPFPQVLDFRQNVVEEDKLIPQGLVQQVRTLLALVHVFMWKGVQGTELIAYSILCRGAYSVYV